MSERLEEIALLLILALCLFADGLMNTLGLGGFALVSAVTMTAVAALHICAEAKGKAPYIHADQSQM